MKVYGLKLRAGFLNVRNLEFVISEHPKNNGFYKFLFKNIILFFEQSN